MRKKFLVIVLSVLIFLSGTVLGVSAVYRVNTVTVNASLVTAEAKTEAESLQRRLEESYQKSSIFFVNDAQAKEIMEEYPYFRLTKFEKVYPNRLAIEIIEDAEVYALEHTDGTYYLLGEDGTLLDIRDSSENRLSGEENVKLKGLTVSAVHGEMPSGDECFLSVMEICKEFSSAFGGIRSNVISLEVFSRAPETIYLITMREGVKIYIGNAKNLTLEKAQRAINEYTSLSYEEKLTGRIIVSDSNGELYSSYSVKDEFKQ